MPATVTIEIPASCEPLVRQFLALQEELQALALSAADGTVLNVCEAAAVSQGRELTKNLLADAVQQRIHEVEKKGPRSAPAPVEKPKKIVAPRLGNS